MPRAKHANGTQPLEDPVAELKDKIASQATSKMPHAHVHAQSALSNGLCSYVRVQESPFIYGL